MNKRLVGFDTLRFIAASLVVLAHGQAHLLQHGAQEMSRFRIFYKAGVAVDFFFVLSGFLLTYLAIQEFENTNTINIKAFFERRIRRIFPLYFLTIFLGHAVLWVLEIVGKRAEFSDYSSSQVLFYHFLFLPNYVTISHNNELGFFSILWSIGVEEQFYLFFPFLMLFLFKRKSAFAKLFLLFVGYFVLYFIIKYRFSEFLNEHISETVRRFVATLSFHLMLFGASIALLAAEYKVQLQRFFAHRFYLYLALALNVLTVFIRSYHDPSLMVHVLFFGFLLLILLLQQDRLSEPQALSYLGKISFGIYIFHAFVGTALRALMRFYAPAESLFVGFPLLYYILVFGLSIGIAHLSYRYFEQPFLKK
jgi:peptidoglycan/LPS O-acetylase OafA/YrhL